MEVFFKNSEFVLKLLAENRKIFNELQGWVYACVVGEAIVLISTRSS